jgi:farnesyl diphosphate synthase
MHIHKTGALIRASALLGARCGDAMTSSELESLDHFSKLIGLAYQVVDDVLDAEVPTATLGKTAGKDADHNKPTYVSALGLSESKQFAQELRRDALKSLDGFGDRALRLRELADFIVLRNF